ncbi:MAG TPA: SGNH/GDSL hydrolase family protein [Sphingobacteriaceae bacterium]
MIQLFRKVAAIFIFISLSAAAMGQDSTAFKFIDGHHLSVSGRGFTSSVNYHRLDTLDRRFLPRSVQKLALNSAGLFISFKTDAKAIRLVWRLAEWKDQWNMTPLAVNGLDLYGMKDGSWQYVASAKPTGVENSAILISNLDGVLRNYRLYLPLYTEIKDVKIGVNSSAIIQKADAQTHPVKNVVIYGSSITQGASASRPGMAYPSIISRKMGIGTINLGFSGSGKMEMEIVDVLARIPADVYILDCVANPLPQQIKERAYDFVSKLRSLKPGIPIIMVESIFRETGHWDQLIGERTRQQNIEFRNAYTRLKKDKVKDLYYVRSKDLIGNDHEATIDGTHLTDAGFIRISDRISKSIKKVIN